MADYRYVPAGAAGNVPAGTINARRVSPPRSRGSSTPSRPPADQRRSHRGDQATRPRELNFNRAVTLDDMDLARRATNRVKKVRALGRGTSKINPSMPETYAGMIRQEGTVFVIILPDVLPLTTPRSSIGSRARPST